MTYEHFDKLPALLEAKLITKRPHPSLPIDIYNYTAAAQRMPIPLWTPALNDCRGLILDHDGEVVGRPFSKFWNYEQVLDQIPNEPFTVWEKLDGSLGIVCSYAGERVVATRGSFESDQAKWFSRWLAKYHKDFLPSDTTYLFEIVYPENRIVVDYCGMEEAILLAIKATDGVDLCGLFGAENRFLKAHRYELNDFTKINEDPEFAGHEGFVVCWQSGFRAKVKLEEYKRLHRIVTQTSTRTIWEILRAGGDTTELLERVPADFKEWTLSVINGLQEAFLDVIEGVRLAFHQAPQGVSRKEFAEWARQQKVNTSLLFALLDGKDIIDRVWKIVEPAWATPFRKEIEE